MIAAENVGFRYGADDSSPLALHNINLHITDGSFVAILGPNGSGKSTLGRCLNGLLRPSTGTITVDGIDTGSDGNTWEIHRRVGMIFQNPDNQLVSTTVERELSFGLENIGLPPTEIRSRVEDSLNKFHLTSYRNHAPHLLSGGQKQRLAIAAVLVMEPRYLVCDEPTAMLDPQGRSEILDLIQRLNRDHNLTVVYITQWPEETIDADAIVVMQNGKIVAEAPSREIIGNEECLRSNGLDVPASVYLAEALRERGLPIDAGVMKTEELVGCIRGLVTRPVSNHTGAPTDEDGGARDTLIDLESAFYTYQSDTVLASPAVREVSLRLDAGTFSALVGANGSGKSTLMQLLNGLLSPQQGTVSLSGLSIWDPSRDLTEVRRKIGLVFQFSEAQLFEETVFADVAFGPRNLGLDETETETLVHHALESVRLDPLEFSDRDPLTLSGGEKRRVALAGILSMRPVMLALDEPTAGLDAIAVQQVEQILKAFQAAGGTVLLVSHDMDLVSRLAERVIVMDEGRIIADGTPAAVFSQPDLLDRTGLQMPRLAEILMGFQRSGLAVDPFIHDVELAADRVAAAFREP